MATQATETTTLDVEHIAREAALECARISSVPCDQAAITTCIAAAIRRAQAESFPSLFQELSRQLSEARAILKEIEWEGGNLFVIPNCPACHNHKDEGHEPDCKLAKVLNA